MKNKKIVIAIALFMLSLIIAMGFVFMQHNEKKAKQAADNTKVQSTSANIKEDKEQVKNLADKSSKNSFTTDSAIQLIKNVFANNSVNINVDAELQSEMTGGEQDYYIFRVFNVTPD